MSIVVLYNGQRKTIKATPNALIQSVLTEAAEAFGLDPNRCELKYKKSTLDKSQPFRFCNLPNNALVDLCIGSVSSKEGVAPCKVALSVMNGCSCVGTFEPSLSLNEMLLQFVSRGDIPSSAVMPDSCPEVIFLRNSYTESTLKNTTLGGLGLAGQSARFQFRFKSSEGSVSSGASLASASASNNSNSFDHAVAVSMEVSGVDEDSSSTGLLGIQHQHAASAQIQSPLADQSSPLKPSLQTVSSNTHQSSSAVSAVPSHYFAPPSTTGQIASFPLPIPVPTKPAPVGTPDDCLNDLLSSNFDSVTKPCVITIAKYVCNILSDPSEPKFRNINTGNKVFTEKVAPAVGAAEFLASIGFRATQPQAAEPVSSIFTPPAAANANATAAAVTLHTTASAAAMSKILQLLETAMDRLQISAEERPKPQPKLKTAAAASSSPRAPEIQFDPFKAIVMSTAPQPHRESKSSTEIALEQLNKRRLELEGSPDAVDRASTVLMPRADGSVASMTDYLTADDSNDTEGPSDSTLLARSLASTLKNGSLGEDDTPLTTRAVRELQKSQRERVYARTLIRIRFPDRVCLQGYFHPRHTIADVYEWVRQSLSASASAGVEYSGTTATAAGIFELYTSPPRTVLQPFPSSSAAARNSDSSSSGPSTLADLRLVPAALIHLAWGPAHPLYGTAKVGKGASADASSPTATLGAYLSAELLQQADGKDAAYSGAAASIAYPVGAALSGASSSSGRESGSGGIIGGAESKGLSAAADDKADKMKSAPKWLKLGRS